MEAAQIHELYLKVARDQGWNIRPEINVPYEQLSGDAKTLNIALAREFSLVTAKRESELHALVGYLVGILDGVRIQVTDEALAGRIKDALTSVRNVQGWIPRPAGDPRPAFARRDGH